MPATPAASADASEPASWQPQPRPSLAGTLTNGIRDAVTGPLLLLAGMPGLVRQRLPAPAGLAAFARGLASSARRLAAPSASCLNGPIGPGREWAWTTASLNTVKQLRAELGGTVNDVLLAAITCGFRELLIARRELTDGLVVRSLVPISIRGADERGVTTNRLSAVLANLPVAEADPIRRLHLVHDQMDQIKRTHQAAGAELPTLLSLAARAAFQIPQPLVQTVTTNVPGPQVPLYVLGRQMVQAHPYTPIGDNVEISIATFSYLGQVSFGITADSTAAPNLDILVRGIHHGLAELQPATTRPANTTRASPRRTRPSSQPRPSRTLPRAGKPWRSRPLVSDALRSDVPHRGSTRMF
jgi:diacylglycerol O-acyltransferase / wax synthase